VSRHKLTDVFFIIKGSNSADLTRRQAIKPSSLSASSHISTTSRHPVSWQLGGLIGEGAFGKVYLGMNLDTGELMAIKQVALNSAETNQQQIDALQREIELMQDLHHENIVQYLGSEVKDSKLNIFLEYQPGGSIASLLTKFHTFNENIIRYDGFYFYDVARGSFCF
jgi:mitogen-activated protein kinase kinase kinase